MIDFFALFGQLVAGWLLADLIGGLFHWWEDRAAERRWPIIGELIVEPNRVHHFNPVAFTRDGFFTRNWTTWAVVLPLSAAWVAAIGVSACWAAATIGGLASSQVHYWAHRAPDARPAWVSALQEAGVFQSPRHHGVHHRDAARAYCILTNLLNPLLDRLRVWDRLERLLAWSGIPVNGGTR
ncbi:MAG: hypothetical protein CVT77_06585 [Alphaproteobacteria bacterium HGW-Alphaproteobacteria-16]|nr:MAG: hypothetical protein CVT77_06585 [Alphaproteobacteria bacterium HGW-Alphaproteobacteria-16]